MQTLFVIIGCLSFGIGGYILGFNIGGNFVINEMKKKLDELKEKKNV